MFKSSLSLSCTNIYIRNVCLQFVSQYRSQREAGIDLKEKKERINSFAGIQRRSD